MTVPYSLQSDDISAITSSSNLSGPPLHIFHSTPPHHPWIPIKWPILSLQIHQSQLDRPIVLQNKKLLVLNNWLLNHVKSLTGLIIKKKKAIMQTLMKSVKNETRTVSNAAYIRSCSANCSIFVMDLEWRANTMSIIPILFPGKNTTWHAQNPTILSTPRPITQIARPDAATSSTIATNVNEPYNKVTLKIL